MFERDGISARGKALEDEFFRRVDEKLRAELRAKVDREEAIERLQTATGFTDAKILEHLVDAGFTASSIAALALVPLVFVAWADGDVTEAEHRTILDAASIRGVDDQPGAISMIENWLHERPDDGLWKLWRQYASDLSESLDPAQSTVLYEQVLRLATAVAAASGGFLGRGKISASEQRVLDQIAELSKGASVNGVVARDDIS